MQHMHPCRCSTCQHASASEYLKNRMHAQDTASGPIKFVFILPRQLDLKKPASCFADKLGNIKLLLTCM